MKVLSTGQFLSSTSHFDEYGRVESQYEENHLAKSDVFSTTYNDADQVVESTRAFDGNVFNENYSFDTWDRVISNTLSINGQPRKNIHQCTYNLEGLLYSKNLGGTKEQPIQSIDYQYNVRGWMRLMNQDISPFTTGVPLPACDPVTSILDNDVLDPIEDYLVTIEQLLAMRFDVAIGSATYEECNENLCDTPANCTTGDIENQLMDLEEMLNSMTALSYGVAEVACNDGGTQVIIDEDVMSIITLPFSFNIVRIHLCNDLEYYVFEQFLNQLSGDYYVQQIITVHSAEQLFELKNGDVTKMINLEELLHLLLENQLLDGAYFTLDDYNDCGEIDCETIYDDCTLSQIESQNIALNELQINANNIDFENIEFPVTLNYIGLCGGATLWVLETEMDFLIDSPYELLDLLVLNGPEDLIAVDDPITESDKEDLFCMQLDYDLEGNINKMLWQTAGREVFQYDYLYDPLYRLTTANFSEHFNENGQNLKTADNRFGVGAISYDPDGNILSLVRNGIDGYCEAAPSYGLIDQLIYSYSAGNRLTSVNDGSNSPYGFAGASGNYEYDAKGNMTSDPYKGVALDYNFLNLPDAINSGTGNLNNLYDAGGFKRQKQIIGTNDEKTIDYFGGIDYIDGEMAYYQHAEGRIVKDSEDNWIFEYCLKDHLGNTRVMFRDLNNDGTISTLVEEEEFLQENHYYPFGMSFANGENSPFNKYPSSYGKNNQDFKYNGKELQDEVFRVVDDVEIELGLYDYGARFYDPSIGRFTGVDPISDQFPHVSTYNYAENEPVGSIDLWGLQRLKVNGNYPNNPADRGLNSIQSKSATIGAVLRHPSKARKVGFPNNSNNLSSSVGRISAKLSTNHGGPLSTGRGGEQNAFRHALISGRMTQEVGVGVAREFGNAHEGHGPYDDVSVDMSQKFQGKNLDLADSTVDVLNNEIGRSIAEKNSNMNAMELAGEILSEFRDNGLFVVNVAENGTISISREKLTEEQYNIANDMLQKMDENGRDKK